MKSRKQHMNLATQRAIYYGFIDTEPTNHSQNAKKGYRNLMKRVNRSMRREQRKLDHEWAVLAKQISQHLSQISPERQQEFFDKTGITWID